MPRLTSKNSVILRIRKRRAFETLCAGGEREQIMLVSVGGVGAVKNVTLGVFNSERLQYESQQFSVSV
jgi:predicted DNA-binding protein with PD1-like motif